MRGKLFLSTPGPDEHPRSAPFDFNRSTYSAGIPLDKHFHRKPFTIKVAQESLRAGLRCNPAIQGAIFTTAPELVK
jgi:hypothetical protein